MTKLYINTERIYLMSPTAHFAISANINFSFNENDFNRSIEKLVSNNPSLSSTVQFESDGRAYFLLNSAKKIPISNTNVNIAEIIKREDKIPFSLNTDSLIRIFTNIHTENFDVLFYVHHLLCDGKSLLLLLNEFIKIYAGENTHSTFLRLINNSSDFPKNSKPNMFQNHNLDKISSLWKNTSKEFSIPNYLNLFNSYHQKIHTELCVLNFNEIETQILHKNSTINKVTISSAVISALLVATEELNEGIKHRKISVSIDIRRDLNFNAEDLIGNYISIISFKYRKKYPLWADAKNINAMIKQKLESSKAKFLFLHIYDRLDHSLIDSIYFNTYGTLNNFAAKKVALAMNHSKKGRQITIANLGPIENIHINSINFFPAPQAQYEHIVGIVTLNKKTSISIRANGSSPNLNLLKEDSEKLKKLLLSS